MSRKSFLIPFVLVTSLFFLWGLANNMTDTLLAAFKKIMSMSDFQTSLIQVAFYGSYFCLALPAAIFIKKFTYKAGVLLGLGMFAMGALLFYPASNTMVYGHFLVSLFILAGGLSVLETTANPYIIAMGSEETGTRRLNLAQSFNPIGSISGVIISKFFILSNLNQASADDRSTMGADQLRTIQAEELNAVMGPYVSVAFFLLVLWLVIAIYPMPRASEPGVAADLGATFKRLLKKPHYVWGVVAQFFYVGAQIGVWSFTIRYVMQELNLNEEQAASYYIAALILFTTSRFICTFLMKYISPQRLLTTLGLLAVVLTLIVILGSGKIGVLALVGISGCMSLMFPTIFGLSSIGLGEDRKIGGSGQIMAIVGGAVVTMIQGQVSDMTGSINISYSVPLICFLIIVYYALRKSKMVEPAAG
jgi:FHS family L-fucose permease-like MFS transporter